MTDLTYTATEARKDFFGLLKSAKSGKRRVIVGYKKARFEIKYLDEMPSRDVDWSDFFGKGDKKTAGEVVKAKRMVNQVTMENIEKW